MKRWWYKRSRGQNAIFGTVKKNVSIYQGQSSTYTPNIVLVKNFEIISWKYSNSNKCFVVFEWFEMLSCCTSCTPTQRKWIEFTSNFRRPYILCKFSKIAKHPWIRDLLISDNSADLAEWISSVDFWTKIKHCHLRITLGWATKVV